MLATLPKVKFDELKERYEVYQLKYSIPEERIVFMTKKEVIELNNDLFLKKI